MRIKEFMLKRSTLEEFAEREGLEMEIHERSHKDGPSRFYAHFRRAEVIEGGFLAGVYGNGPSQDEAMTEYIDKISGQVLVVNAGCTTRREIVVPILTGLR